MNSVQPIKKRIFKSAQSFLQPTYNSWLVPKFPDGAKPKLVLCRGTKQSSVFKLFSISA